MRLDWLRPLCGLRSRLLAFNLLLVFLPVAGLLFLETFERRLLADQERTMVSQARILTAALSEQGVPQVLEVRALLARLGGRSEARLRVVDPDGRVLGDSSRVGPQVATASPGVGMAPTSEGWVYRLGALPFRWARALVGGPTPPPRAEDEATGDWLLGREVRAALAGRYGAASRISSGEQRSVTLYSAVPIRDAGSVVGAVVVSRSTLHVLETLYALRARVFGVFLASLAAAAVLSLYVSRTIAGPLRALRDQASLALGPRGRMTVRFDLGRRRDEIGQLAAALETLRRRLAEHVGYVRGFGADVSHELANPLASIRSASEMLGEAHHAWDRRRFSEMIARDVARMERILADVREMSRLDEPSDADEPIDLVELVRGVVDARHSAGGTGARLGALPAPLPVRGASERLCRVLENVLDNAESFHAAAQPVEVELIRAGDEAVVRVLDRGPGIPDGHLDRIFSRFFSYRPEQSAKAHSGLGLAIASAILAEAGGQIRARNRLRGGACFEIRLPLCTA